MYVAVLLLGLDGVLYVVYLCGGIDIFGFLHVTYFACLRFVEVALVECRFWDGGVGMFSFQGSSRPAFLKVFRSGDHFISQNTSADLLTLVPFQSEFIIV
jgi:hypothetical protein